MSGAGGQYSSIGSFDPTKMTVGEFVRQYVDKAKGKTGEALSEGRKASFNKIFFSDTINVRTTENWDKKGKDVPQKTIRNPFVEFQNMTMAEFYANSGASSDVNPLIRLWEGMDFPKDHTMSRSQLKEISTAIGALDFNMEKMSLRPEFKDTSTYFPLRNTVTDPGKGQRYGVRYGYNPDKMSLWYLKVMEAAKNDPSKAGLARAALTLAETGFRPNMILDMPLGAYNPATEIDVQTGTKKPASIFLSETIEGVKMGEKVIVPISNQLDGLLQGQWDSVSKLQGSDVKLGGRQNKAGQPIVHMFYHPDGKPITSTQLGNFIKSIKVPGIMEDFGDVNEFGQPKQLDSLIAGSVELRRMWATAGEAAGLSREQIARATGRNLVSAGGGSTGVYVSLGTGSMTESLALPTKTVADLRWAGWNRILKGENKLVAGKAFHPNLDMIGLMIGQYGTTQSADVHVDVDDVTMTPLGQLGQGYFGETRTLTQIRSIAPTIAKKPLNAIDDGNSKNMGKSLIELIKKNRGKLGSIAALTTATGLSVKSAITDAAEFAKETAVDVATDVAAQALKVGPKIGGAAGMIVYPPLETGEVPLIERPEYSTIVDMAMEDPPAVEDDTQPTPPSADEQTYNFINQQNEEMANAGQ